MTIKRITYVTISKKEYEILLKQINIVETYSNFLYDKGIITTAGKDTYFRVLKKHIKKYNQDQAELLTALVTMEKFLETLYDELILSYWKYKYITLNRFQIILDGLMNEKLLPLKDEVNIIFFEELKDEV